METYRTDDEKLNVIVFSGDGDLFAIGGNHFIHAARRNMDLTVICINNFIYGMTGGQVAATTPHNARSATTPYGNPESPFNLPLLAIASGATYVARWTMIHTKDLTDAFTEAMAHRGFSFIEVLSPCPINYARRNKIKLMDLVKKFQTHTIIRNDADPRDLDVDFEKGVVLGKFVDIDRPTPDMLYEEIRKKRAG